MRITITEDGRVRSLWNDEIDWSLLGPVTITRASHVEFCNKRQRWYVQAAIPRSTLRWLLQKTLRRPFGEVLFQAPTRQEALEWERVHFEESVQKESSRR